MVVASDPNGPDKNDHAYDAKLAELITTKEANDRQIRQR